MQNVDVVIVGAGVVGLAIAVEVTREDKEVVVIERLLSFGQETSSRNSEVIHSGLYYPKDSLKARFCVEGKKLLYQFCEERNIAYKRIGKLIVATNHTEAKDLEELISRGKNNGVEDLNLLTKSQIKEIEPSIQAICAIHSPSTGIIDTHQLMGCLEFLAKEKGAMFAYNCEALGIERKKEGYQIDIRDADGEKLTLSAPILINSAGLCSDKIAQIVGIDIKEAGYELYYCKGEYFRVSGGKSGYISRLVYPAPQEISLGIHAVVDLQGQLKLGPNAFYVEEINYDVNQSHITEIYDSAKRFLPFLELNDLSPDMAGIRPKLQEPGVPVRDFIITHEKEKGFPGLINLIGIESPGLTACLSIGKYVKNMVK